jgi:hypothetical protein
MTMSSNIKTILALRPFKRALTCPILIAETQVIHMCSSSKFRVFATKAFRSEKSRETSDNLTEISGEINKTFETVSTTPKFRFW